MRGLQAARGTPISSAPAGPPPALDRRTRARLRLLFATVALLGLAIDQVSKIIAVAALTPNEPVPLLGGLLTLRLIRNPGAAFSLGEGYTYVFALLATAVLAFVVFRLAPRLGHPGWAVALGLLCAGVSGNLVDRLVRSPGFLIGHVVDFLQLPYIPLFTRPIFNLADVCITSAAVLIMILSLIRNVSLTGVSYAAAPRERRTGEPDPHRE